MKINKELSKKIKRLISIILVPGAVLFLTDSNEHSDNKENTDPIISSSDSIEFSTTNNTSDKDEYDLIREQIEYHEKQEKMKEMIESLSSDMYDKEYNDYCNDGKIIINDKEYMIKDLYIEYGFMENNKMVYLIDYHNPKIDIITGQEINSNYQRMKIVLLKYSQSFYDCYKNQGNNLLEYLYSFDGSINYEVPETHFLNPNVNSERGR